MLRSPSGLLPVTLLAALLAGLVWRAGAARADDDIDLRQAVREGRLVALDTLLADARRRVDGRVVDVELDLDDDELRYEIEILDADGVVWELEYDARSGRFLSLERDD